MTDIESLKRERSKAKQAVTVSSRRLTNAVRREVDDETLTNLTAELDKAYDEFCEIDDAYKLLVEQEPDYDVHRVVNGEDLALYASNVCKAYEEAREGQS